MTNQTPTRTNTMKIIINLLEQPDQDTHILLAVKSFLERWQDRTEPYADEVIYPTVTIEMCDDLPVRVDRSQIYELWRDLQLGYKELYQDSNLKTEYGLLKLLHVIDKRNEEMKKLLKLNGNETGGVTK